MKTVINTPNAPAPIGPYNQAIKANGFIFVSGQVAIEPETGVIVLSSIAEETHQVMKNLQAVLKAGHSTLEKVVMSTIFLSDMNHFSVVNEIYSTYFSSNYPARATVAVKTLPKNVNVEIAVIALE